MTRSRKAAYRLYREGVECEKRAEYAEAGNRARDAVAIIDSLFPDKAGESGVLILFRALGLLGRALRQRGLYTEAEAPLLRAIKLAEAMPEYPERAATAWNDLGVLCKYAGWFERGTEAYARALAASHHEMLTATILHNIGGLDHARGRFDEAEEPSRRAWEIRREHVGEDHPATLADAVAYAAVLDGLGRYGESRPIYEHALAVYERVFGPEHYETATTLHNLALVERAAGNREKAVGMARRSYEIKLKLFGKGHPDTALSAMNLASFGVIESRALLGEALQAFEAALAPDHPHTVSCRRLMR